MVTADPELLEQIQATAAAAGIEPAVVTDPAALRSSWSSAAVVVVGIDQAAAVADAGLSRRADVYLVGAEADHEALCSWSGPLRAAVVVLPSSSGWLTASLAEISQRRRGRGRLVAVIGGSGGVGVSTWAAGLAVLATQAGVRTVLVDADPLGGGLDLLMGAERVVGWRWSRLAGARGHLGDLTAQLPSAAGVHVLSVGRSRPVDPGPPGPEQLGAVLRSTSRSHELTIVDLPRSSDWIIGEVAGQADLVVLLARADVRGVSAARAVLDRLGDGAPVQLVVRNRRTAAVTAAAVADGLVLPLLGTVADDSAVRVAAERGDPPPRSGRTGAATSHRAALQHLLGRERDAA